MLEAHISTKADSLSVINHEIATGGYAIIRVESEQSSGLSRLLRASTLRVIQPGMFVDTGGQTSTSSVIYCVGQEAVLRICPSSWTMVGVESDHAMKG